MHTVDLVLIYIYRLYSSAVQFREDLAIDVQCIFKFKT